MVDYYGPAVNGRQLMLRIEHAQDVAGNFSQVRTVMYLINGSFVSDSNMQVGLAVGGVQVHWWQGAQSWGAGTFELVNSLRNIPHNSEGNASVTFQGAVQGLGAGFINLVVNVFNLTLPTIPRATTPNWSGDFEAGTAKTINLPRASSSFVHDVRYAFGDLTGWISADSGVTTSWTPPMELLTKTPNTTYGTGAITVTTRNGASVIGATSTPFTLRAPPSVVPTVDSVLWDDGNTTIKSNIGAFVQGLSLISGSVTASGIYGSTIKEERIRIGTTILPENSPIQITGSGLVSAFGEAVDSRGRLGSAPASFTVLPYSAPAVSSWQVRRSDASGVPTDLGQYLRLDMNASVSSLKPGATEKNAMTITVRTRPVGGAWTTRNVITPGITYNTNVLVTGGDVFLVSASYEVEVSITDKTGISASSLATTIPTAVVTLDLNGTNLGIGKYHENGVLDVAGDVHSSGDYYSRGVKTSLVGHTHTGAEVAAATDADRGTVELATQAEVNAGTDTTRAVTPATLRGRPYEPHAVAGGIAWSNSGYATVVYPVGRFSVPPVVHCTIQSTANNNVSVPWFNAQTASSFNVAVFTIGGSITTGNVSWTATQMSSASAGG